MGAVSHSVTGNNNTHGKETLALTRCDSICVVHTQKVTLDSNTETYIINEVFKRGEETETDRQRQRKTQTDTETDRDRETETERKRNSNSEKNNNKRKHTTTTKLFYKNCSISSVQT